MLGITPTNGWFIENSLNFRGAQKSMIFDIRALLIPPFKELVEFRCLKNPAMYRQQFLNVIFKNKGILVD